MTLGFWILKILATTLGETGGDAVSMSMDLGYLVGSAIFMVVFVTAVVVQIKAKRFHPVSYWATIIASTTVGTTLADFATRSLGIGYAGGACILFMLLIGSFVLWYRTLGSVDIHTVGSPQSESLYWLTIMISQTLGTALGDWTADTAELGYLGGAAIFSGLLAPVSVLGRVRADEAAWRRRGGLPGQARGTRRPGIESLLRNGGTDRVDRDRYRGVSATGGAEGALTRAPAII